MTVLILICLASAPTCSRDTAVQAIRAPQRAENLVRCFYIGQEFAASLAIGPREGEKFSIECKPTKEY